jgi:hypothetical protein
MILPSLKLKAFFVCALSQIEESAGQTDAYERDNADKQPICIRKTGDHKLSAVGILQF